MFAPTLLMLILKQTVGSVFHNGWANPFRNTNANEEISTEQQSYDLEFELS